MISKTYGPITKENFEKILPEKYLKLAKKELVLCGERLNTHDMFILEGSLKNEGEVFRLLKPKEGLEENLPRVVWSPYIPREKDMYMGKIESPKGTIFKLDTHYLNPKGQNTHDGGENDKNDMKTDVKNDTKSIGENNER